MSETPTNTEAPADSSPGQAPKVESFSADYVKDLREEAARYRNEKKQAVEDARTEARTEVVKEYEPKVAERDQAISQLQQDLSARDLELLKLKAVLAEGIPSEDVLDVVTLIQGDDEESVSESVKRVKALLGKSPAKQSPVDHSQGRGGDVPPLNGDKVLNILKAAVKAH